MFCLLHQTTMLFDKHEHKYTAKNHEADNSFCACPQIYSVRPPRRRPPARTRSRAARTAQLGRRQWCAPRACETHMLGLRRSRARCTRAGPPASGLDADATAVRSQRGA